MRNDTHYPDVSWTAPIDQFLRADFVLGDEYATTHTTIEDALSHRSGLPGHDLMYGQPDDTTQSIVQRMRYLPMTAEPRTVWQYCNIMYAVMTELLETVTGVDLETLLHDKIWSPLGMESTSFTLPSSQSALARGYYWDSSAISSDSPQDNGTFVPEPYIDILPISGAGATISTVNDYALWIKALLSVADPDTPNNSSSPITKAMFHDLLSPRSIISKVITRDDFYFASPALYSLGWFSIKAAGEVIITHTGGLTGFGAAVYLVPRLHFGIVMMGNTAITSNEAEAVLASILLRQKLVGERPWTKSQRLDLVASEIKNALLAVSQVPQSQSIKEHPAAARQSNEQDPYAASLPLPGVIEDFAGLYTHPAYGLLNFTVVGMSEQSAASGKILQAIVKRTWAFKLELRHTTDTVFALKAYTAHGLGDLYSEDIVWELANDEGQAIFKFGLDGEIVETMGIELEASMVEVARAKGPKAWKEGMIWFEKM